MVSKERDLLWNLKKPMQEYVSQVLLYLGSIKIAKENEKPFKYTSENVGPIYVDCRIPISYPIQRKIFAGFLVNLIKLKVLEPINFVAGGATAGMPFAQDVADFLGVRYFYIRKKGKKHGMANRIVGDLAVLKGRGILVEDLITNGGSKVDFIEALRTEKVECKYCFTIFDREQGGWGCLNEIGVELHSLTTMGITLGIAVNNFRIDKETFKAVRKYLDNPKAWAKERGYEFKE